jgi:hypothetical protein
VKLKVDDAGHAVVQDGKPIYVADDGKEIAFDYGSTLATISRLNGEAKSHRERAEGFESKLRTYDGIEDPAAAREALEKLKDIDLGKMVHQGKVDEIKAEAQKAFDQKLRALEEQYKPVISERDGLRSALHGEIVGGSFSRSKFITDKLAIPPDMVQARFGQHFQVEEGNKIIAQDASGNRIFSRARPGEIATFDEALETLVDAYPYRDNIIKGTGASGSGASGGNGSGGKKTVTRAQFEAMSAAEQATAARTTGVVFTD